MTFSIVARCKRTGMLGMAVSTARPAVGNRTVHVEAKVGAIATQAATNPYLGINGLSYLKEGLTPTEVMDKLKREDPESEKRQLSIVDHEGRTAGYTGRDTVPYVGQYFGDQFVVAGNMLVGEEVIQAMVKTFEKNTEDDLSLRLLATIKAGEDAGGDKRGRESAALKVVDDQSYPIVDLRSDLHENPIDDLMRIYEESKDNLSSFVSKMPIYEQDKRK